MSSWLITTLHLLALACGLPAIWTRSRLLAQPAASIAHTALFKVDNWWTLAMMIWLITGATSLFFHEHRSFITHPLFYAKLACLCLTLLLEAPTLPLLHRWKHSKRSNWRPSTLQLQRLTLFSQIQTGLILTMTGLSSWLNQLPR